MDHRTKLAAAMIAALSTTTSSSAGPGSAFPDNIVIIRQIDADLADRFRFARTIGQILTSAGIADTAQTRRDFVKTLFASYGKSKFTNPVSGVDMTVDVRAGERDIDPDAVLDPNNVDGMIPIGLFNRIDLAPANWTDCGEHRIVYALKPGAPHARFFVIFEAKLPSPALSKLSCQPVAKAWIDIGNAPTAAARNAALDQLYYQGLPGFRPVVDYRNYGSFLGQVRTNNFAGSSSVVGINWQLREFRVLPVGPQLLTFFPSPVASNPLAEYYKNSAGGGAAQTAEGKAFRALFAANYQSNLRAVDATEPPATSTVDFAAAVINKTGGGFDFRFNEFQSDSQKPGDAPLLIAGGAVKASVLPTWTSPVGIGRTVARNDVFARATAMTCGGCHQLANSQIIGHVGAAAIAWPASAGFVHISEFKNAAGAQPISPALTNFWIPFRKDATARLNGATILRLPLTLDFLVKQYLSHWPFPDPGPLSGQQFRMTPDQLQPNVVDRQRRQAEALAGQIVAPIPGGVSDTVARAMAERQSAMVGQLRRLGDFARARDTLTPGVFVPVRRPH